MSTIPCPLGRGGVKGSFFFLPFTLPKFLSFLLPAFLSPSLPCVHCLSVCFLVFFPFTCPFSVLISGCACLSFSLSLTFLLVSLTHSVHLYLCLSNAVSSLSDPLSCVSPHLSVCLCLCLSLLLSPYPLLLVSLFPFYLWSICLSICLSLSVCLSLCASVSVSSCLCLFIVLFAMFC